MVKVDYDSDIYQHIVVDSDGKIIGWVGDEENPAAYDFSGNKIGQAITNYYAKEDYERMVYTKIKENSNSLYEPAKDATKLGEIIGNITRVMFLKVNDDFKIHLVKLSGLIKYDYYDRDEDKDENSSRVQYREGMDKFFDDHIDNSKLGLDSASIKAAKGQFWGSIDNAGDEEEVENVLLDTIKQYNLLSDDKVELDKDGNIEVGKFNLMILNYYVLIVNLTVVLAAVLVTVLLNKKKKSNNQNSQGSLSNFDIGSSVQQNNFVGPDMKHAITSQFEDDSALQDYGLGLSDTDQFMFNSSLNSLINSIY